MRCKINSIFNFPNKLLIIFNGIVFKFPLPLQFNCNSTGYNTNSMDLIIDAGNTFIKTGFFENGILVRKEVFPSAEPEKFEDFLRRSAGCCTRAIAGQVGPLSGKAKKLLREKFNCLFLTGNTPVPVEVKYDTPQTLGADRLAGVTGAAALFPGQDLLVIDAGTSLTFDFIDKHKQYPGGAISPGIMLRFKTLNQNTSQLPDLFAIEKADLIGTNTKTSILSGVLNGILSEVKCTIEAYRKRFPDTKIIFTGGEYKYFVDNVKMPTFAEPDLVLTGLYVILEYNSKQDIENQTVK